MINKRKGFTLLELMVVIIVIGILASLAIPRFIRTAERSRAAEAIAQLGTVRSSMQRYYASEQSYTGASLTRLDIDNPNSDIVYPNRLFQYSLSVLSATTFIARAVRNTTKGGDGSSRVTIREDGTIAGNGVFAGIK